MTDASGRHAADGDQSLNVASECSDAIASENGDEQQTPREEASPSADSGGLQQPDDGAGAEPEGVFPESADAGEPGQGLAERRQSPTFSDARLGQSGGGQQLALFHATAGPLPDVAQLAAYGELDGTFPERIMRMAEASTSDVSRRDDRALTAEIRERKVGQWSAIMLSFTALIAAIVFGALGHTALAAVLLSVPIVLLVRALIGDAGRVAKQRSEQATDSDED